MAFADSEQKCPAVLAWYAIYTKKQKEHMVDVRLLQYGLETFLPITSHQYRGHPRIRPLFPCYLFARFNPRQWLYRLNHLDGVNKVVSFNNQPLPVDQSIINFLKQRVNEQGYFSEKEQLQAGEKVRVHSGLFAGFEGRIESLRPRDRVVVLLNALIGQAKVEIGQDYLEVIEEYTPKL